MIRGIGIDSAVVADITRYRRDIPSFEAHTFTPQEVDEAPTENGERAVDEYFAVRFAAKEAAYKAIAWRVPETDFDFREIETLARPSGAPYINITPALREVLDEAEIDELHISSTTENDVATVFMVAEKL